MESTGKIKIQQEQHQKDVLRKFKKYIEYDMVAYSMFANTALNSQDVFYKNHKGEGDITQPIFKKTATIFRQKAADNLDYVSHTEDPKKLNFRRPTYYGVNTDGSYFFESVEFTKRIRRVYFGDRCAEYPDMAGVENSLDIRVFTGDTGQVGEKQGNTSPMGFAISDNLTKEITIVFRGSSSGGGKSDLVNGVFRTGSADWVTDMQLFNPLKENKKISENGKFQDGFAQSYLSCRDGIVDAIKKIRQSDPHSKIQPKLVTTGHSLGGGLANLLFIDAKVGTLGDILKEELIGDDDFVDNLLEGCECYTVSAPPVSDNEVNEQLSEKERDQFHRTSCANDKVPTEANHLRLIKCADAIELDKISGGPQAAHGLYRVYDQIQKRLGTSEEDIEQVMYKLDDKRDIVNDYHESRQHISKPLTKEKISDIALQFDEESFIAMAYAIADNESGNSIEEDSYLSQIIQSVNMILASNPFSKFALDKENHPIPPIPVSEENFEKFKIELENFVIEQKNAKDKTLIYMRNELNRLLENYKKTDFENLKIKSEKYNSNIYEMQYVPIEKSTISAATIVNEIRNILKLTESLPENERIKKQEALLESLMIDLIKHKNSMTASIFSDVKKQLSLNPEILKKIELSAKLDRLFENRLNFEKNNPQNEALLNETAEKIVELHKDIGSINTEINTEIKPHKWRKQSKIKAMPIKPIISQENDSEKSSADTDLNRSYIENKENDSEKYSTSQDISDLGSDNLMYDSNKHLVKSK